MFKAKGIIPAMVTPLTEADEINELALRQLVRYLIGGGVHGLFPVGSQGEFFSLTFEEKRRVLEVVVDEAKGRVPVYAGTGAITTREAIALTRMAEEVGADAVSVITPFYINPSQSELYDHYAAIARATRLPLLLYTNPARTGVDISVDTAVALSKIENIIGIKDSSGDLTLTAEFIRRTGEEFCVLAGRDTLIYAVLTYGGTGAIAATANVAPKLVVEIYEAFVAGDHQRARRAQAQLAPLRLAFQMGTFPVVIKEALNLIGIAAGPTRRPIGPMSEEKRRQLAEIVKGLE